MNNVVKLVAIVEELDIQFDEVRVFFNTETGEIISVSSEHLRAAEDEEPYDHLPDWEQEDRLVAEDVIEHFETYKELPTKYEINEYEIMEDFCLTVQDHRKQDELLGSIKGKGVFRRFKDMIIEFDIEDEWYSFREKRFREIAIKWCEVNGVRYIE